MRNFVDNIVAFGPGGLLVLAAMDSAGIPIPAAVDALLLLLAAKSPAQAALCAMLALSGSLAGSMLLFWISRRGGEAYLARRAVTARGIKMRTWFQHYGLLTVFISAISPIPLPMKLFVISAGALGVRPLPFFLTVLSARVPRYAALAYLGAHLGQEGAGVYLKAHAWQIGAILAALFAFAFGAIKIADARRVALLTVLCAAISLGQPARYERLKLSAGDFYSAESILEVHRLDKGEDAEYKEGLAWAARGAALIGDWDAATVHAVKLRKISEPASYGHATAIEVEAQILEARGKKKEALRLLDDELRKNASAPVAFRSRIQKRWNQIGLVGREAPDFEASLNALRGKPVVLYLWAEWCGDCKARAPAFVDIVKKYTSRGVAFLAPTRFYDDKDRNAERRRIAEQWRTTYSAVPGVGIPISDEAMISYGASATPTFVVIDRKGIVTFYSPTRLTEQRLASEIEKVLR
ncbi:MAG: VTT domain-containing protein [Bryobacteraceae bacterium]